MIQTLYNGVKFGFDHPDLENIEKIDMGALPMIHRMTQTGLPVDLTHFVEMDKGLTQEMDRVTEEVYNVTGYRINLSSPPQKSELLFKKLGLKQARPAMTKSGDRESVENEVLVAIQHDHPAVPLMLEYAEYDKLRGTYVRPMPKLARRVKLGQWRMFPNLGHTRVPAGRLNCKEPNLLAMPNRTEWGRRVCEGFYAPDGWIFLSVDESQIEPRVCAHSSGDEALINVYLNDEDIYSDFATSAFQLHDKRWECDGYGQWRDQYDVLGSFSHANECDNKEHLGHGWHYPTVHKKDHRFPAKTCILAWIYDVTAKGLLEQMPIVCKNCGWSRSKEALTHTCGNFEALWTEELCQDLINSAGLKYPGVIRDRKRFHLRARKHAYNWDMWGRLLHVAAVRSTHDWVVQSALREIGNFPYQGGAQGTIKLVMAQVEDEFVDMGLYDEFAEASLQIHDELLFLVKENMADEIGHHVSNRFENCVRLAVPIKAGQAKAYKWGLMPK